MKTLNELIQKRVEFLLEKQTERNKDNSDSWHSDNSKEYYIEEIKIDVQKNIPKRYLEAKLIDEDIINKIKNNLKEKKGIYFYGTAGTGKTYLLYAILRRLRASGYMGSSIWNLPDKLSRLRGLYSTEKFSEDCIEEELKVKSILLIDDFGAEKQTEWNTEIMYRLINHRYENILSTFFASNLSLQELAEKSGDRLASRIAEMCEVVNIDGEDKRLKESNN